MKLAVVIIVTCGALVWPAAADLITTQHFGTLAEVQAYVVDGFDFVARGDTAELRITRADPPAQAATPFNLWNNGIPHGFKVVYNAGGIAGISIDDLYVVQMPVTIDPATNGLLVTAFTEGSGRTVRLDNLRLTLPGFVMYDVPDVALAPPTDYLLIETSLPLTDGFILSGTVTFSWSGSLPPAAEEWFEVAPVVVPEPTSMLALVGGVLLMVRRRVAGC